MRWTRKYFDQWEWYHKPISPMEETLLLPQHINSALSLITERLGIVFPKPDKTWRVIDGYLYFASALWKIIFQQAVLFLPFRFFNQLKVAKKYWLEKALPDYQMRIEKVKSIDIDNCKTDELLRLVQEQAALEGKVMAEAVYVVIFALFSEIALKIVYKYLVCDTNSLNYHDLIIGYPDKGIEGDTKLWEIAQEKNQEKCKELLNLWIKNYGHRIQDKDILYPTIGENPSAIQFFIKLYENAKNPQERVKQAIEQRLYREKFVKQNLKPLPFATAIFNRILALAQGFAQIRNSRPYLYQSNFIIRRLLLKVGKLDVFFLTFDELKQILEEKKMKQFEKLIKKRKSLYKARLTVTPPLEVIT